jgi:tetratricopeptide (TPR) repeat protein
VRVNWAGSDALDLLRALAHGREGARLRVVGAYRDTEVEPDGLLAVLLADLASAGLACQHTPGPLTTEEVEQLLDQLLAGVQDAGRAARRQVLARAGGVPFFVLSCAQALRRGALEGQRAAVPWDVAQSVRQRVAALPSGARDVLEVAAVVGRVMSSALLVAVAPAGEREVLAALRVACRAHLLEEAGQTGYRFAHDVIREVVEANLGTARRALLHRDIAQALEATAGEPAVEVVAYHYAQTDAHAKAAHWLERAGDQAASRFANAAAVSYYSAARERGVACGADPEAPERLDEKLGDLRYSMGAFVQAQEDFARARARAADSAWRVELARKECEAWNSQGEYARALAALAGIDELGGEAGAGRADHLRAAVAITKAGVYYRQGAWDAAEALVARALTLVSADSADRALGHHLAGAALVQGLLGQYRGTFAQAEECFRRSLALGERHGDQWACAFAWGNLSRLARLRGQLSQAEEYARRGLVHSERIGHQDGLAWCCSCVAHVAAARHDMPQAEEWA